LTLSNPAEQQFTATVGAADRVTQVTLLHTGSATHGANLEQTFQKLLFVQDGATLTITSPTNPNYTVPGDYLLFVFNENGVPSEAKIIRIFG